MKRYLLVLAVVLLLPVHALSAQTVTCTLAGLSAGQQTLLDDFIAAQNSAPNQVNGAPFADFNAYCGYQMKAAVLAYIAQRQTFKLELVGTKALVNGLQTASNAQCTAASLANGCTKAQVACFVLTGNAACN